MAPVVYSLASVAAVSLVSLVGIVTLPLGRGRADRIASVLVSFAVGALLGDAFLHLLPEAFAGGGGATLGPSLLVLGGMMLFFAVEKLLRHGHARHPHRHPPGPPRRPELAAINLIGDGVHNFIDGVLIAASYLVSPVLGLSTTIAVMFHEIPQELGDFGVLLHAGLTVRQALLLNLASASVAVLGTVATLLAGGASGTAITGSLVPLTAGGFVYIAAADLIPELQRDRSLRALLWQGPLIVLGVAVMAAFKILE